jgi:hypothetical protein
MDIKIDKNICFDNFKFQKWVHVVDAMDVGDSVFFKKSDYASKKVLYSTISYRGYKPVSRMDSDPVHGEGYRVWKLDNTTKEN